MNRAPAYRARLARLIARCGEPFDLTRAGVAHSLTGVFGVAGPDTVAAHFDPATAASLNRPVLTLALDGDASPAPEVGDALTCEGRALTVRAVDIRRVEDAIVCYFALLD